MRRIKVGIPTQKGEFLRDSISREKGNGGAANLQQRDPIYMPPNESINPAYNIRTDRMEIFMNAMDKGFQNEARAARKGVPKKTEELAEKPAEKGAEKPETGE